MTIRSAALFISSIALLGAGCEENVSGDALGLDELSETVSRSLDDVGAPDGSAERAVASLEVDDASADESSRRQMVIDLVLELAEDEPCALRGVLAGRYDGDGNFEGRAFRRGEALAGEGGGTYTPNVEGDGGTFEGEYVNIEGGLGDLDGTYAPRSSRGFGTLEGMWTPMDNSVGGNLAGMWHPLEDGENGVFIGYWSRCDIDPVH